MTDDRLRVLLVAHYFPPHVGGIENVVLQQARSLTRLGADVTVLTTGPATTESLAPEGFRIVRVAAYNGIERRAGIPFPVPAPGLARRAAHWVRRVDVVHVHDCLYPTSWAAGRAAIRTRTPLVMTQHVGVVDHPKAVVGRVQRAVYRFAGRKLLRSSRYVAVVNTSVGAFVRELGAHPDAVELLPNGVDTALFRPPGDAEEKAAARTKHGLPPDKPLVLFVGRPVPKKGYPLLLQARHPDFRVVCAGERPAGPRPDDVHHLGPLGPDELAQVYRACDIFALPSTSEGFPLTVQEAMASGLPVVTTDDPGYAGYGLDPSWVTLIPRDAGVLRERLRALAARPDVRTSMGDRGRAHALAEFSWCGHAEALMRVYRQVLSEPKAART